MKTIKIAEAEKLFPPQVSPCCSAPVQHSYCTICFQTVAAPYYFIAEYEVPAETLAEKEANLRERLPFGACVTLFVPLPK